MAASRERRIAVATKKKSSAPPETPERYDRLVEAAGFDATTAVFLVEPRVQVSVCDDWNAGFVLVALQ